jgi:RNA polymerase sigma-70 factor (TIGR02943 family)
MQKELSQWVEDYTAEMLQWTFNRTGNMALSEDLVQDTFLAAAEKFYTFKNESSPKTWLIGILKFKIADHFRKQTPTKNALSLDEFFNDKDGWLSDKMPQTWEAETQLLDNPKFVNVWQACIDALPQIQKNCITLKYLEDIPAETICQDLALSSANYWQIIHRAKVKLRNCLEQNWFTL